MNSNRILNMVLGVALVASLAYNFILSRQSEAAIFMGAGGEIIAVSGLVKDTSGFFVNRSIILEEPDTGEDFKIRIGQSTHIRILDANNNFTEAGVESINVGDSLFVSFTQEGKDGVARSIDVLPGFITN